MAIAALLTFPRLPSRVFARRNGQKLGVSRKRPGHEQVVHLDVSLLPSRFPRSLSDGDVH